MIQSDKKIRVLGIDPGFGRVGYGIIENHNGDWVNVNHGCLETDPKAVFIDRLYDIHLRLSAIIMEFQPTHAGVEQLFFAKNTKTAIDVGQARGVILLTLRQVGLPIDEFTPLQVKQAMTGYGNAEKHQVQHMVAMELGLSSTKMQDDAADALAVALTYGAAMKMKGIQATS